MQIIRLAMLLLYDSTTAPCAAICTIRACKGVWESVKAQPCCHSGQVETQPPGCSIQTAEFAGRRSCYKASHGGPVDVSMVVIGEKGEIVK